MKNRKLLESIADIAYITGNKGYFTGDSRADISTIIYLAKQFEKINKVTDWNRNDYFLEIETFAKENFETT